MSKILLLDAAGNPNKWAKSRQDAIIYHAKKLVAWELGADELTVTYRGGQNRISGQLSQLSTAPIIAVRGETGKFKRANKVPSLTNSALFRRDQCTCAYCGKTISEHKLTRDHIVPTSRGGTNTWTNVVSACAPCNNDKDDRLLEECGMHLLYIPYVPTMAESLVWENKHILPSQLSYLSSFIPQHSRIWKQLEKHKDLQTA